MTRRLANAVRDYQDKHGIGSCPIENGSIGNLADNECRHGNLPTDKKQQCACFPEKPKS